MKKPITLLLSFTILLPTLIFPDELDEIELTPSQEDYFIDHRLSLESAIGGIITHSQNFGFMSTYKFWQGSLGFEKINEETFFRTAGHIEIAEQARKYRITNNILMIVGGILCVAGVGIMLAGISDFSKSSWNYFIIGGGVSFVSLFPLRIGFERSRKNQTSANQAQYVLENYNNELIEFIKKNVE